MIAPFPATSSRTPRPDSPGPAPSESVVGPAPSQAAVWGARLVQCGLALYLIPVLALILLIGGAGLVVGKLAALGAYAARWIGRRGIAEK